MNVKHTEDHSKGKFYISENGDSVAEMGYHKLSDKKIDITYTNVNEDQQGRGLGTKLVERGVNFARENDIQIIPSCPFVKNKLNDHEEWQDVL